MSTTRPVALLAYHPSLDVFDEDALLADVEVVIGHWGCPPIDRSVLDRAPKLRLFAYGAGTVTQTITTDVLDRGVRVTSGATANAEPVAEFTLASILYANKDVIWQRDVRRMPRDPSLRSFRQPPVAPVGNADKMIGIVGASLIGRRVIELLEGFPDLDVGLYDPFVDADEAASLGVQLMNLDELCSAVDVLSIHAPDLPSTRRMIGDELQAGRLSAVLDVTDPEPLPDDHPLWRLPNAFVSPHVAGSLGTELQRMVDHLVDEIERWSTGRPARNEVTADSFHRLA